MTVASIFGGYPMWLETKKEHSWYQNRLDVAIRNGALPCLAVGHFPFAESERVLLLLAGAPLLELCVRIRSSTQQPRLIYTCGTHWVLIKGACWAFVRDVA